MLRGVEQVERSRVASAGQEGPDGRCLVDRVARDVADTRAFLAEHRLPGLVDCHVHDMPPQVLRKVQAWFDALVDEDGTPAWPVRYRGDARERREVLVAFGLRRWPTLLYPHRPGMAAWLNDWAAQAARDDPRVLRTATLYPEPGVDAYVREALDGGARVVKVHLEVGAYDPADPLLRDVWGELEDRAVPVVLHGGDGPRPGPFTGPGTVAALLRRHPRLVVLLAHLGMPDHAAFVDLVEHHENAYLDTTMGLTDFSDARWPVPPDVLARYRDLGHRLVFGSDFPNIPYSYAHPLERLARLAPDEEWLRAVVHDTAARLYRVDEP